MIMIFMVAGLVHFLIELHNSVLNNRTLHISLLFLHQLWSLISAETPLLNLNSGCYFYFELILFNSKLQ